MEPARFLSPVNDYDQQRRANIAHNNQRLQALGILQTCRALFASQRPACPRKPRKACSLPAGPKRQSRRLAVVIRPDHSDASPVKARRAVLLEGLRNRGVSTVAHQSKPDQTEKPDAKTRSATFLGISASGSGWTHPTWKQERVNAQSKWSTISWTYLRV